MGDPLLQAGARPDVLEDAFGVNVQVRHSMSTCWRPCMHMSDRHPAGMWLNVPPLHAACRTPAMRTMPKYTRPKVKNKHGEQVWAGPDPLGSRRGTADSNLPVKHAVPMRPTAGEECEVSQHAVNSFCKEQGLPFSYESYPSGRQPCCLSLCPPTSKSTMRVSVCFAGRSGRPRASPALTGGNGAGSITSAETTTEGGGEVVLSASGRRKRRDTGSQREQSRG